MKYITQYLINKKTYFIIFLCILSLFTVSYGISDDTVSMAHWEYRYGNHSSEPWQPFSIPGQPLNPNKNTTVYIRTQLPDYSFGEPTLFFVTNDQYFEVFLDGSLIYQFGSMDSLKINQATGSPWHMIDLPNDYSGKILEIKMKTNFIKNTGLIRTAKIGCKSDLLLYLIRNDISTFVLSLLFIFLGLGIFALFLMRRRGRNAYFALGFASLCVGVWLFAEGDLKQLLFYAPRGWLYVAMISFFLIPVGFCMFVEEIFVIKYKFILKILVTIQIGFTVLSVVLDKMNVYPIIFMLVYEYLLMAISFFSCTTFVSLYALQGDQDARIFSLGFIVLTLSGLYDILGWYYRLIPWFTFTFKWAMLVFVLILVYILGRRFSEIHHKVETYSLEIQDKDKQLEQALIYDKMKTEFFSNISHEFRTPLNIILSSIQLLHFYIENDSFTSSVGQTTHRLKIMQQNTYRLIRLLNNLIDITKIDADYFTLTLQNHNIIEVVEDITISVADYVKSKGISLTFDTDVEEKVIACDPDLIERVLLNLLSNAIKFTYPGAHIWVNIHDLEDQVVIKVRDSGIGIEKEKLSQIFERFVQVDKSLTRQREGSGIGLSLVKSIVKMHDGTITVDSEMGVGTTFSICLPAKVIDSQASRDYVPSKETSTHVEKINVEFSDIYS